MLLCLLTGRVPARYFFRLFCFCCLLLAGPLILGGCSAGKESLGGETLILFETADGEEPSGSPPDGNVPSESNAKWQAAPEVMTEAPVTVFVCGAVREPGVFPLPAGARLADAVEAAGGFAASADREWLNLARVLEDGEQIRVPAKEETLALSWGDAPSGPSEGSGEESGKHGMKDGKVDLNTAGADLLMTLPGIGEAKAAAIIAYREEHGAFTQPEEIMQISGIKQAVYDKIKDKITV